MQLHQILYLSHLARPHEYDAFASICHVSRHRNAQLSLTGVLLFDGYRFCQLLQGPSPAVQAMMAEIARDRRHEQVSMLFDGAIEADTAEHSWNSGFCDVHELDVFEALGGVRGEAAMAAFRALLPRADLAP
jgi:hypothetical protein